MNYIPLHTASEYSFLSSGLTIEKYLSFAKNHHYPALGICDYQVMFGFPYFVECCQKNDIKPILGMSLTLGKYLLCLFIKNELGYQNLIQISNALQDHTFNYQVLLKHQDGLKVVLPLEIQNVKSANEAINRLHRDLKCFYVGLEIYHEVDKNLIDDLASISSPIIAFPKFLYEKESDAIILDITRAIKNNTTLDYEEKSGPNYLISEEEFKKRYSSYSLYDLKDFYQDIDFEFEKVRGKMLNFVEADKAKDLLRVHALEGLKEKGLLNNTYLSRLNYELEVIDKMGFNNYFLIVEDYVKYAKTHDILVGPGRGSAAGSLVSFALDITTPDPLKHQLYFERFLNPSRKTMPDIDIDFEDIRREDVVSYLREKYSHSRVSNIVTFQTIGAKQAIRDIGRVFKINDFDINYLSKSLGNYSDFKTAYRTNEAFRRLLDTEPYYLKIVRLATKIEGLIRQSSIHAAGIILNEENLENVLPTLKDENNNLISQYEMTYLERQGFLKMDILALRNLTIIKNICRLPSLNLDPYNLPIDDEKAIKIIQNNQTLGIFQLESRGMKKAISTLKPSSFDDVVALIALFRPGPMDNIPLYAQNKEHQESITYINDDLKRILAPTFGIIIYQEQIMRIATDIAGLSLADADNLRRAMSKKDLSKMEELQTRFINGCVNKGYNTKEAQDMYATIEKFASYGFNKAHSISYAYICLEMAYLKAHYPLEFYATLLDNESSSSDKIHDYLQEIKALNIKLMAPNINESETKFKIFEQKLLLPLTFIRGLPRHVAEEIVKERNIKKFSSFFDFVNRMYKVGINEDTLTCLIDAGALDCFETRATLRSSISNALNQADFNNAFDNSLLGQKDFGLHFDYVKKEEDKLFDLEREYATLGFALSDSPLKFKQKELAKYRVTNISDAKNMNGSITLGVLLHKCKVIRTKKGEQMAYLSVSDETGELEIIAFPREYLTYYKLFVPSNILLIKGYMDTRKENSFIAETIRKLED